MNNAAAVKPDTVDIVDLDTFVKCLVNWHTLKTRLLRHMAELPEGSEMTINDVEPPLVIAGETLAGFKAGIELALMELGTLPFVFEQEPKNAPPATPDGP